MGNGVKNLLVHTPKPLQMLFTTLKSSPYRELTMTFIKNIVTFGSKVRLTLGKFRLIEKTLVQAIFSVHKINIISLKG